VYSEELVREIVNRVLLALKGDFISPGVAAPGRRKVMVVVTGATIGWSAALEGLVRLKEERGSALDYTVLFSGAGAEIHNAGETGEKLKASEVLVEGKNHRSRATAALKQCDLVAVPALTRATAARTALMLLNSAATEVIMDALMRGLPVIAARDAADPTSEGFARMGMNRANPALISAMAKNLEQMASYGVTLLTSDRFGWVLEKMLFSQPCREKTPPLLPPAADPGLRSAEEPAGARAGRFSSTGLNGQRAIITREDLPELVDSEGIVRVARGAVVTPLVMDIIRDAGWRLEEV